MEIKISKDNVKLNGVKSLSLPPVVTCREDAPCVRDCYACKMCRIYKGFRENNEKNLEIYKRDADLFFAELTAVLTLERFFRLHVSGDFPDSDYFARVVKACRNAENCQVLAYTKQYEIVNDFIKNGGKIPKNLHIIFSNWFDFECENPFGFPVSNVARKVDDIPPSANICSGDCSACLCRGVGCWSLKNGESVYFVKH